MPNSMRRADLLVQPDLQPYLSRLSGAGSLRRELEAVLDVAPVQTELEQYRKLILEMNAAGKRSASMRLWTWKRLKVRYLLNPMVPEFRAFRWAIASTNDPGERGLLALLMMARTDRLFREVVSEHVSPFLRQPGSVVDELHVSSAVDRIAQVVKARWTRSVVDGLTSHILSASKDYGLLKGNAARRTVQIRPGLGTVALIVRFSRLEGLSDRRTLDSRWFRLLGMNLVDVLDLMHRAARQGALRFQFQADLAEIELPELQEAFR